MPFRLNTCSVTTSPPMRNANSQRNGDRDREERREDRKLDGERQANLDLLDHGMSCPERLPEVAVRDLPHPIGELVPDRLVQSEEVALLVDDRLRNGRARVLERN